MERVNEGLPIIGLYPLTDSKLKLDFEEWKSKNS
jgi:hypothetical protein